MTSTNHDRPRLPAELDGVAHRLKEEFTEVPPTRVEQMVAESADQLDDGPIKSFVPLLAERRSRDHLRAMRRQHSPGRPTAA